MVATVRGPLRQEATRSIPQWCPTRRRRGRRGSDSARSRASWWTIPTASPACGRPVLAPLDRVHRPLAERTALNPRRLDDGQPSADTTPPGRRRTVRRCRRYAPRVFARYCLLSVLASKLTGPPISCRDPARAWSRQSARWYASRESRRAALLVRACADRERYCVQTHCLAHALLGGLRPQIVRSISPVQHARGVVDHSHRLGVGLCGPSRPPRTSGWCV